jgi:hypothetical protein
VTDGSLPADVKRTSSLRRVPTLETIRFRTEHGLEGDVCAFELPRGAFPITVESPTGRMMAIAPGDAFLATPGYRESKWWAAGSIPAGGLVPGGDYWVLADSGLVGELNGGSPLDGGYLGRVRYLGAVYGDRGERLNIRQFAVTGSSGTDRLSPLYLILGTAGSVGKTTAGIAVLQALRMKGHTTVIALKATGTSSLAVVARYQDFGAAHAFDCIDFGLPSTYPAGRPEFGDIFANALGFCLSFPSAALVVECGGDLFGAGVPEFLTCLKARRPNFKIVLAAADALGAMGAKAELAKIGLTISLITGPCTDTPVLRERTEALSGISAINLAGGSGQGTHTFLPVSLR